MIRCILIYLMICIFAIPAMAKYVAVLETVADPEAGELVKLPERIYLTDVLRSQAVKQLPAEQNFTIMTRENISVMLPPGKSIEDCEGSCLAETGRNIAADYVAQARIVKVGESLALSAEMYETAGNKLLASFNGRGANVDELEKLIKAEAPEFFKKAKGKSANTGFGDFSSGGDFSVMAKSSFIVDVVTNPEGAVLSVDGRPVEKCPSTPCKIQVEEGEHRFLLVKKLHEDVDTVLNVSVLTESISFDLKPNFGVLEMHPQLQNNPRGNVAPRVFVDGENVENENIELEPGVHQVSVTHPCYDPLDFKVGVEKMQTVRFDQNLVRGVGGLRLNAERNGEPVAVNVYVDDEVVGKTPFVGEVPLCTQISIDNADKKETVDVDLRWHETVEYTHHLKQIPVDVVLTEKVAPQDSAEKTSLPTEIEQSNVDVRWLAVGASVAVTVVGTALAIAGNSKAKNAHDRGFASEAEYKKNKDDAHQGQNLRTAGVVTAIIGAVGLGLSFAF